MRSLIAVILDLVVASSCCYCFTSGLNLSQTGLVASCCACSLLLQGLLVTELTCVFLSPHPCQVSILPITEADSHIPRFPTSALAML